MWTAIVGALLVIVGVLAIRGYCRKKIYKKTDKEYPAGDRLAEVLEILKQEPRGVFSPRGSCYFLIFCV